MHTRRIVTVAIVRHRNTLTYLLTYRDQPLAETWTEVWGGRSRRISAENFFLPSPQNVKFGGGRRGTHCIREFQYLTHGFCVYIVDFVDFNI